MVAGEPGVSQGAAGRAAAVAGRDEVRGQGLDGGLAGGAEGLEAGKKQGREVMDAVVGQRKRRCGREGAHVDEGESK